MKDFRVVSSGSIQVSLKGNILIDWLSNFIVDRGDSIFHRPITEAICNEIKHTAELFVKNINQYRSDDPYMVPNPSQCFV